MHSSVLLCLFSVLAAPVPEPVLTTAAKVAIGVAGTVAAAAALTGTAVFT